MDAEVLMKFADLASVGVLLLGKGCSVTGANRTAKKLLWPRKPSKKLPGFAPEHVISTLLPAPPKGKKYLPLQGRIEIEGKEIDVRGGALWHNGELAKAFLMIFSAGDHGNHNTRDKEIQALRERLDTLEQILQASYDEVLATDGKGYVFFANQAFESHYGVPVAHVIGKHVTELEEEGLWEPSVTPMVIQSKQRMTIQQRTAIGKVMIVTGTPVLDEKGEVKMVVCNARDATEMAKLKSELEKTRDLVRIYQKQLALHNNDEFIVCRSMKMQTVLQTAGKVSRADVTVLLRGESGVGKDVIARAIHKMSSRREKPFLKVNCASIPEHLMEAELFGYKPGAFTGAQRQGKAGLMEIAQGGTIFLDEIGELPVGLQAKLLQVLDEKQFLKLGDTKPTSVNVRIIASTNRDLEKMIDEGSFRRDLFHRLNAISIFIPPLRERPEDVLALLHYYLDTMNKKYQTQKQFSPKAIKALLSHKWPGNVRELAHLVEHLIVTVDEDTIDISHLPPDIPRDTVDDHRLPGLRGAPSLSAALEALEGAIIREAYNRYNSSYQVAKVLGISQSAAYRKHRKYIEGKDPKKGS